MFSNVWDALRSRALSRIAIWLLTIPRRHPRPPWEQALAKRSTRSTLPDGTACFTWGHGPTVLLVHGWRGRGTQLGAFIDPLVAKGFRVVAVDAPAHGDSPGRRIDPVTYGRFLKRVGDLIGNPYAVVAHSLGGVATMLAMREGLQTERVVLLASHSALPALARGLAAHMRLSNRGRQWFFAALERRIGMPLARIEVDEVAGQFVAPALLLHGRKDREVPFESAEHIANAWHAAHVHPVSNVGHHSILRAATVIATAVDFLGQPLEKLHAMRTP